MFKQLCVTALTALVLATASFPVLAGQESSAYEEAKEKNHGHVGIHQRREAYREYIANNEAASPAPNQAQIEPAAGDAEKANDDQSQAAEKAPAQDAPEYNQ